MHQSSHTIDQSLLDEFGSTAKGLFALDYLLFELKGSPGPASPTSSTALELLSGSKAQRRGAYLLALARDLQLKAEQLATDWSASDEHSASAKFVAGGQQSVNLLVNQLAKAIEEATD